MPLSDIYQISERMLDSARSQTSTEAFFGPEAGLVELVWESGQVKSRRRCIRTRQDEAFPSVAAAVKRQKGSETDSHDFSIRGINRDDNAVPWFSCPAEEDDESLQRGYYSGLFPELPDVLTANHSMPSLEQGQSRSSIAFGFDQEEDEPGGVLGKDEECDLQKNMTRSEGGGSAGSSSTCPVYSIMNTLNGAALPAYPNSVMEQSTGLPQMERKPSENEESEGRSDDAECESVGMKKGAGPARSSGSRRSRAAEVHNLSERRRRDRINEKMRALQELIPNCNKVDKASMLDEAIEYLKTLQLQVQIMSMGAGYYVPSPQLMFQSGLQPVQAMQMSCLPHVRFGMGFGMRPLEAANGLLPPLPTFHSTTQGQGGLFYDPNPSDYPRPGGISAHGVPLPVSQSIYTPNSSLIHNARFSLNTIPDQFHSSHT